MKPAGREDTLTWVVLVIGIVMFLALAYATVILWNAANPAPEIKKPAVLPDSSGSLTPVVTRCPDRFPAGNTTGAPWIAIDPVPDHAPGEIINFTGTTNLAAGEPLVPEIYSAEIVPCPKGPTLPDSVNPCGEGFAGKISVALGNCGINTWSWSVDTSQHGFQPGGQYLLSVSGRDGKVQNSAFFNITGSQG